MDKTTQALLLKCLTTANKAGVPQDQAQQLVQYGYIPYPWQWLFHAEARHADTSNGPTEIGLGGARGPGKSHAALSQTGIDDCQRFPGLKGLFLRQTGIAAKESFDDLITKTLSGKISYERSNSALKFSNGSRIVLGGFKDAGDIDKYVGVEYDLMIIEELNQLTLDKYTMLLGSLRTSKKGWRPRVYASFNPGGRGHEFVKERFVIPYREGTQTKTRFIPSTYKDNPALNKEYIEYLEGLEGDLGKAWREGDWDLFRGQVFSEFRRSLHVVRPVVPSKEFSTVLSMDWGYSDKSKFAAYLTVIMPTKTEDGDNFTRVITYKEWSGNLKNPYEWAEIIYNDCRELGVKPSKAWPDAAMLDRQSDGSKSIGNLMEDRWKQLNGDTRWISLIRSEKHRPARIAVTHNWLSVAPDGLPYVLITESCPYLIKSLPTLIYDEIKVDDVDTTGDDHGWDGWSYGLVQIKFTAVKPGSYSAVSGEKKRYLPVDAQGYPAIDPKEFFGSLS